MWRHSAACTAQGTRCGQCLRAAPPAAHTRVAAALLNAWTFEWTEPPQSCASSCRTSSCQPGSRASLASSSAVSAALPACLSASASAWVGVVGGRRVVGRAGGWVGGGWVGMDVRAEAGRPREGRDGEGAHVCAQARVAPCPALCAHLPHLLLQRSNLLLNAGGLLCRRRRRCRRGCSGCSATAAAAQAQRCHPRRRLPRRRRCRRPPSRCRCPAWEALQECGRCDEARRDQCNECCSQAAGTWPMPALRTRLPSALPSRTPSAEALSTATPQAPHNLPPLRSLKAARQKACCLLRPAAASPAVSSNPGHLGTFCRLCSGPEQAGRQAGRQQL